MANSRQFRNHTLRGLFTFTELEKPVQVHLKNVYSTLSIGLLISCAFAYLFMWSTYLQAMTTGVLLCSFLGSLGSTLYIYFTPHTITTISRRLCAFFIMSASTGLGLGPLLHMVSIINPETIPTALLGSAVIFVSFSLASLMTRKRLHLIMGAILMSAISMLATFSFMNLFIRSPAIYQAELYIGFLIFCGFVVFDTQMIVEKRRIGDTDFIWHSLDLFIDFVELFRHLLIILNSKRDRRRDED